MKDCEPNIVRSYDRIDRIESDNVTTTKIRLEFFTETESIRVRIESGGLSSAYAFGEPAS